MEKILDRLDLLKSPYHKGLFLLKQGIKNGHETNPVSMQVQVVYAKMSKVKF